jgi:hypothetical protein
MPLSGDVPSNPFRCRSETSRGCPSLLHAVLAVSCYHAGRQASEGENPIFDVVDHQNTAIKLYSNELDAYTGLQGVQLLDTMMVLFLFNVRKQAFIFDLARYQHQARQHNLPSAVGLLTFLMRGNFLHYLVGQKFG